jgi:hypothetical protein
VESIHDFISKTNETINAIDWSLETPIEQLDTQRKRGAVTLCDELATFSAGTVVKFEMVHDNRW